MLTTPESALAIQALLAVPLLLFGVSHLVQPKMWVDFFTHLHSLGPAGVVFRTFALELVPAVAIVTFHLVWTGPEVLITIYGLLLTLKISVSVLAPSIGLRSLAMAQGKPKISFVAAGVFLIGLGLLCVWQASQGI